MTRWITCTAVTFLIVGCRVDPAQDYGRANRLIRDTTRFEGACDPQDEPMDPAALNRLLEDGLSLDEAVRIALLNSRRLQSAFLEIGIARAEWVQSGLLSNPSLGLALLFPEGGGRSDLQVSLAQNIVDLWQIPIKRRAAEREVEATILRIARTAGELTNDVKRAYYNAVAAEQLARLATENVEVFARSHNAIRARREAGAAAALDENLAQGELLQAQLALRDLQLQAATAKRELARLMSIDIDLAGAAFADELPEAPPEPSGADELIAVARDKRLDLKAMRETVRASDESTRLQYASIFPEISVGPFLERMERRAQPGRNIAADFARASIAAGAPTVPDIQTPGERRAEERQEIDSILGPSVTMTLPVFDQNQAQIARARSENAQAVKSYEDLYIGIANDIRIASDRAGVSWSQVAFYRDELIPQAQRNLEYAEASYQAGGADFLTLLQSQRSAIQVRQAYVTAWSAAAIASADLELAVGAPLGAGNGSAPNSPDAIEAGGEAIPIAPQVDGKEES